MKWIPAWLCSWRHKQTQNCLNWPYQYSFYETQVAEPLRTQDLFWLTCYRGTTLQETWVWSLGREDPLEKEMAIHSSILAWRIPWSKETTVHGVTEWDMTECRHVCISGTTTTRNVLYYKLSILSYDINVYQSNSKTKKEVIVLIYSQRNWDSMKLSEFIVLNHMISKKVKNREKKKKRPSDSSLISCL